MAGGIQPLIRDPVVGYRLDPGEPGVANPTRASLSAYTVVRQESRNRARLRSDAQLAGRQVLLVKTDYKVRRVGSFLVPVGGLTTVVSRERPERATPAENLAATHARTGQSEQGESPNRREAAREMAALRAEQGRLKDERRALEQAQTSDTPAYEAARTAARSVEIQRRLQEIA